MIYRVGTYAKVAQEKIEAGQAASIREAARLMAEETGETEKTDMTKVRRGVGQVAPKPQPIETKTEKSRLEKLEKRLSATEKKVTSNEVNDSTTGNEKEKTCDTCDNSKPPGSPTPRLVGQRSVDEAIKKYRERFEMFL